MKSSNSSLTFSGRPGAFTGWLLGERSLIQALRKLYRLTQVGQLVLKRSSAFLHAAWTAWLRTPPVTGCSETQSTSLRHGWDAKSQGAETQHQGLLLSTPWGGRVWGAFPQQVPHINPFLLSMSSLPWFPAIYPVSGVPKPVSYSRHKHFLF